MCRVASCQRDGVVCLRRSAGWSVNGGLRRSSRVRTVGRVSRRVWDMLQVVQATGGVSRSPLGWAEHKVTNRLENRWCRTTDTLLIWSLFCQLTSDVSSGADQVLASPGGMVFKRKKKWIAGHRPEELGPCTQSGHDSIESGTLQPSLPFWHSQLLQRKNRRRIP